MVSNREHLCKTSKLKLGYLTFLVVFVLFLSINASFRRLIVLFIVCLLAQYELSCDLIKAGNSTNWGPTSKAGSKIFFSLVPACFQTIFSCCAFQTLMYKLKCSCEISIIRKTFKPTALYNNILII